MELFRERLNSVVIQNNFFDEALDVSREDSEGEISSKGDSSLERLSNSVELYDHSFDETYHRVLKKLPACELKGQAKGRCEISSTPESYKEQKGRTQEPCTKSDEANSVANDEFPIGSESSAKRRIPLNVSKEVLSVIDLIDEYKPATHELETKFKCFIPSFIPAIGDPDPFLKVPRPDGMSDGLGLTAVDEPSMNQSEISVVGQQLRSNMKRRRTGSWDIAVKVIKNASENPHDIDKWIASMAETHRRRPAPQVLYKYEMPANEDITIHPDILKAVKDDSFADALSPELDMTLYEYACLICTMLDLPLAPEDPPDVKKMIYHLHFLFSLYIESCE